MCSTWPRRLLGASSRPRQLSVHGPATVGKQMLFTSLPALAEGEQPIIIHDDEGATILTGGSAGSGSSATAEPTTKSSAAEAAAGAPISKRRPMLNLSHLRGQEQFSRVLQTLPSCLYLRNSMLSQLAHPSFQSMEQRTFQWSFPNWQYR